MSRETSQSAGGGSQQYGAGQDINLSNVGNTFNIYGQGISREEAAGICREVLHMSMPDITAAALEDFSERGERLTLAVLERVIARDPKLLNRFSEPRIQIALSAAQKGYGETGDEDLGALLANLVSEMISEPVRTHREQLLRQCVDLAPKLSLLQLNGIAVVARLTLKYYPNIVDPQTLLGALDEGLRPYYGSIPSDYLEYEYMQALGVWSERQVTAEAFGGKYTAYTVIHGSHRHSMCKPFRLDELPPEIVIAELAGLIQLTSPDSDLHLPSPALADDILESKRRDGFMGASREKKELTSRDRFADFVRKRSIDEDEFESVAKDSFPELAEFLETLTTSGALRFRLGAVGMMLADQELAIRDPEGKAPMSGYFVIDTNVNNGSRESGTSTTDD
ncbi:LPO_1073/Vpar_1526 family protein [Gordonia alkanivorans]|uniref:Uncharacterized protein n=1 Tax=Gordonia alkanivorans NBRC 16433 TaxID=1027371 RepID=F9VQX6_9ACTN|nr:LPO_1073/Vpar_1526 family protein [Gordonia alkanivorans]GAA11015.1 hypothetical protein GOALK_016_01380 [Gordonia alkanivorans NBRC 16433]